MASSNVRLKTFAPDGSEYYSTWVDYASNNSQRWNGRLWLTPQPFWLTRNVSRVTSMIYPPDSFGWPAYGANVMNLPTWPISLDQQARERAYTRLRSQDASLAMTLATLGQTRDMIRSKATGLAEKTVEMQRRIEHARKRGQLVKRNTGLANAWLEYFYGWSPFLQDCTDAIRTVSSLTPEAIWVSGRAQAPVNQRTVSGDQPQRTIEYRGNQRCTYSMRAEVTNPNLWMANRLGLINPGTVLWDVIPWSFVVGMFINANALIASVTEDYGLSVSGHNTTQTTRVTRVVRDESTWAEKFWSTTTVTDMTDKHRILGSMPVQVVWKTPKLDWSLAVTASALLLQRVNKLNSLADRIYRSMAYPKGYTE